MRISIVNSLYAPYKIGGAEVSVQILAETLVEHGHQVQIICLNKENNIKKDVINGVDVCYIPLRNIYWPYDSSSHSKFSRFIWHLIDQYNPIMAYLVGKQLKEFNPDVVHTNNLTGFSISIWDVVKKMDLKLIHTARDYYLLHPNCTLFKNGKNMSINCFSVRFWSFFKKIKSRKVDIFVGISHFMTDIHKSSYFSYGSKFCTVYNPVKKINIKTNLNKLNTKTVGFIGRLSKDKGFDQFCDIADSFKDKEISINFIAAGRFGNDNDGEYLKEKAIGSGIKLLGFSSLESFLSQVDAVVLPIKWREPFGRTVVECSYHVPVFTSPMGGVKELMKNGRNIYDISEFCNVKNIFSDCGDVFDEHDAKMFDKDFCSGEYESIYKM